MRQHKIPAILIVTLITISCDYYKSAMTYKDNSALELIVSWDSDNKITPNAFDYDGKCFMKKNNTWMLLNGDSAPKIKTMSGEKVQCLERNEIEWVIRICESMTKKDEKKLHAQTCNKK